LSIIAAASNAMAGPEQAHKAVARLRQLNPALRVSTLRNVVGPWRAETSRDWKKECGEPGCPNDHRSQVLARWR
jgi:hypothetical protein